MRRAIPPAEWKSQAACIGMDPNIFFPNGPTDENPRARQTCATCAVRLECLDFALRLVTTDGIWGGTDMVQREAMRRRRRRLELGLGVRRVH